MTNLEIIKAALSQLGVLLESQEPTAEQGELGLATLNDLLGDWTGQGIDIGQETLTSLAADFPCDANTEGPVKANLAMYLAPHYSVVVSPFLSAQASAGYLRLLRDAMVAQVVPVDMDHLPGLRIGWDI